MELPKLLLEYNQLIHNICINGKTEEKLIELNEIHQNIEDILN